MSPSIVVISLVLQALTLITLSFFLFQLIRQQGRILLRLDSLERSGTGHPDEPAIAEPDRSGLDVGTLIRNFQLSDLAGRKVSLSDFLGRRVLLTYWNAECGFCDMLAPDLARIESQLQEKNTQLLLVSYGDAETNRKMAAEHGLRCPILLLGETPAQKFLEREVFEYCGTPSAYLLDEQGRVAQSVASGMEAVAALASEASGQVQGKAPAPESGAVRKLPLSESRIEREGLKAGVTAPPFSLPDVHGQTVSLDQFRGKKVLLVFSDPQCGPCNELAPDLVDLHTRHGNNGLAVVMVGRGNAEQNKKKAAEQGIVFPVVLQERWKLSREYGIFATPVAFLIGQDGVILRNVAQGPNQIMALAREGLAPS